MKKLNLQNVKLFLKSKKNLLVIFLIFIIFIFIFTFKSKVKEKEILSLNSKIVELERKIMKQDYDLEVLKNKSKTEKVENDKILKDNEKEVENNDDKKEKGHSKTYDVENFSDEYSVKVEVFDYERDEEYNFVTGNNGVIRIFNQKNSKEIISFNLDYFYFNLNENSQVITKDIIYNEDFNLDGTKDFAIRKNNNNCYGSPTFDIYLIKNKNFVLSKEFSDLAQNYCGMFEMKGNEILTNKKSGCCWHEFTKFIVKNGKPTKFYVRTEDIKGSENGWINEITTEKLVNGVWQKEVKKEPVKNEN